MLQTNLPVLLRRVALAGAALTLMAACAAEPLQRSLETTAQPTPAASPTPPSAPGLPAATQQSFDQWRDGFRVEALAAGILPQVFDQAFAGVTPDSSVIEADRSQPEFARPVWEYLDSALSSQRVGNGQRLLRQHAHTLDRIERRYGVERHALVAIWGLESNFGQIMGNKSVIRSLATLAHEGRRPEFARSQLLAALRILQDGDIGPERMRGSWAGAMGQTQFIPTTYQDYAVDFDGNGRRDIWGSEADALASAAHYLQRSGWQSGQPWGFEVRVPSGFDYALADPSIRKPLDEWRQLGLTGIPAMDGETSAGMLLPAGHRGPAFLVLNNFRTILRYNNSSSYALAISLLAERMQGGGEIAGSWPKGERPLSRSERIELQERLTRQGFELGAADSIIGANTRKAIRDYQRRLGWPADGYPTHQLLERLRQEPLAEQSARL
ncbi:lytic murein transglycosylase [Stutzerimonas tarimensis]|uniref:Lytic murein transglycosylase n=1 Tax=Stutzerimonas tarimensis TaxID=1507735 RepID=A0ABV7T651_9GAMM